MKKILFLSLMALGSVSFAQGGNPSPSGGGGNGGGIKTVCVEVQAQQIQCPTPTTCTVVQPAIVRCGPRPARP